MPAYWDDHIDRLQRTEFWSRDVAFNPEYRPIQFPLGAAKPPDATLPYIVGIGWYRTRFTADRTWLGSMVTLTVGGVTMEASVWLDGHYISRHVGHSTPFEVDLGDCVAPGEHELIIAVSNTHTDRKGCSIRGFSGKSAGIHRSVALLVHPRARIADCYVHADPQLNQLDWSIEVDAANPITDPMSLHWQIDDPRTGRTVQRGTTAVEAAGSQRWSSQTTGLQPWSDHDPHLYELRLSLHAGSEPVDAHSQPFGLRRLTAEGTSLRLNGAPVLLRGLTDHAYFPLTCTPPTDPEFYRSTLKTLKTLGFNWIRFHTWTPPEECLSAADEVGMLLQVEAPNGFQEQEWLDILRTCRKHPSVVIYCCGNEVPLTEPMLDYLELMGRHLRTVVPDALFNPMEAHNQVEYGLDPGHDGVVQEPVPHHATRLQRLHEIADVIAPHALGMLSYHSLDVDDAGLATQLSIYQRPCLIHEIGINDSYLNLDLEHRYQGSRIGPSLYSAARTHLREMGLEHNAPVYYANSTRWLQQVVKYTLEAARRNGVAGYDLLGAIDCHWHRTGYAVGLLNEFYEPKPGITPQQVLQYNGESVLLIDADKRRNLETGTQWPVTVFASLYGAGTLTGGHLRWALLDDLGTVHDSGEILVDHLEAGRTHVIGRMSPRTPELDAPRKLTLRLHLTSATYDVSNSWDYWVYPARPAGIERPANIEILRSLHAADVEKIAAGGSALLLGAASLPTLPTTYQIMSGGRVNGNNATVVHEHPALGDFPHEGWCDWQFQPMLEDARAVAFNDLDITFDPIVEVVSSYKLIRKQANLFEVRVGHGRLLVCTMRLPRSDPGARYLLHTLLAYMSSPAFAPRHELDPAQLTQNPQPGHARDVDFTTDEAFDDAGHVPAAQRQMPQ